MNELTPQQILNVAITTYDPSSCFILVSGGTDSALVADITLKHLDDIRYSKPRYVVSLDTLLSADGWNDYVADMVKKSGWPHKPQIFYTNPDPDFYENWCMRFGFPYSSVAHRTMQNRLKLRAVEQIVREHKYFHRDRVMLVSGFRKYESHTRMQAISPYNRVGSQLWVNPIFHYTNEMKAVALLDIDYLPESPYKKLWGVSGDCACGSFARAGELDKVCAAFPCLGKRLCALQNKVKPRHGWGWGEEPSKETQRLLNTKAKVKKALRNGQTVLSAEMFTPLCANCRVIRPGYGEAEEKRLLQSLDW